MTEHPDELLSAYVDGLALPQEVGLVQRHLALCAACRAEVELARQSRAALAALPELDAPPGLVTLPAPREAQATWTFPSRPAERAAGRWRRPSTWSPRVLRGLAAGSMAAAATVAAIVVFSQGGGGPLRGLPSARDEAGSASGAPALVQSGADYSAASLDALARTLASAAGRNAESLLTAGAKAAIPSSAVPGNFAAKLPADVSAAALGCLQRGAGLPMTLTATHLERAAYEGTPAYVGAFVTPAISSSPSHLIVAAVSVRGCQPLHVIRLTL